jgi:hypothetical protein
MSVNLNRTPKPEESQKNLGFEPRMYGLAVGSHNQWTIG